MLCYLLAFTPDECQTKILGFISIPLYCSILNWAVQHGIFKTRFFFATQLTRQFSARIKGNSTHDACGPRPLVSFSAPAIETTLLQVHAFTEFTLTIGTRRHCKTTSGIGSCGKSRGARISLQSEQEFNSFWYRPGVSNLFYAVVPLSKFWKYWETFFYSKTGFYSSR